MFEAQRHIKSSPSARGGFVLLLPTLPFEPFPSWAGVELGWLISWTSGRLWGWWEPRGSLTLCSGEVTHFAVMVLTATRLQHLMHHLRTSPRCQWMDSFSWQGTEWLRLNVEQVGWFCLGLFFWVFFLSNFCFTIGQSRKSKECGYVTLVVLTPCDKFLFLTWGYLYFPAGLKAAPVTSLGELGLSCPLQAPQFISLN